MRTKCRPFQQLGPHEDLYATTVQSNVNFMSGLNCALSKDLKNSDPLLSLRATHCKMGKLMTESLKVEECWKLSLTN